MNMETEDTELHCLVLAAGDSQRLGKPKQLLRIENETLLHRICREAQLVSQHVTVVLGAQAAQVTQAIDDLPVMRINNPDWREGIASSLRAGVLSLPATADIDRIGCTSSVPTPTSRPNGSAANRAAESTR